MNTNETKPHAKVIGKDGNVFVTMGICSSALKKAGKLNEAKEMLERVSNSGSYNEALSIMAEYCILD